MEDKNPYEMEEAIDIPKTQFKNIFQDEKKAVDVPKETNSIPSLSGDLRTESVWNQVNTLKENKIDNINNNISDSSSNQINESYRDAWINDFIKDSETTYDSKTGTITFNDKETITNLSSDLRTESDWNQVNTLKEKKIDNINNNISDSSSNQINESYRDAWINDFIKDSETTYDSKTGTITFNDKETITNLSSDLRTEDEWNDILDFKEKKLTSGVYYNEEATITLNNKLISLRDEIKDIQVKNISIACTYFENLSSDTKNKLKEISITSDILLEKLLCYSNSWFNELDSIIYNLETRQKSNEETNSNIGGSRKANYSTINTNSSSSNSNSSSSSSPNQSIPSEEIGDGNSELSLLNSIVGLITFTEIMPLYEQIGGSLSVNSSLTGNYGLIGIEKKDGVYYYKLLDTKTNKVYYIEFNDKVKIESNVGKIIELKDNTMMLSSTEIGTNNFVKLTDANTLYFVQDTVEKQGITFFNVLDGTDGKSYYIPEGDETLLTTLDELSKKILGDN